MPNGLVVGVLQVGHPQFRANHLRMHRTYHHLLHMVHREGEGEGGRLDHHPHHRHQGEETNPHLLFVPPISTDTVIVGSIGMMRNGEILQQPLQSSLQGYLVVAEHSRVKKYHRNMVILVQKEEEEKVEEEVEEEKEEEEGHEIINEIEI